MKDDTLLRDAIAELRILHAAAILASDDARCRATLTVSPASVRRWREIIARAVKERDRGE